MIDFLDSGRGVYIEGTNFSSYNEGSPLYDKFGSKLAGVGFLWETGNIETVFGQTNSIVDGFDYNYLYQQPPDNLVDYIEPTGGLIVFKSQDGLGRGVTHQGLSNTYRTINTSFIFGALVNGIHTKNDLMETYIDYLTGNTAVEEYEDDLASALSLTLSPNPFSKQIQIRCAMRDAGYGIQDATLQIYDISGRVVKSFHPMPNALGSLQISWDGTDDSGRRVSSGTYIVRIKTDRDVVNKTVVLVN